MLVTFFQSTQHTHGVRAEITWECLAETLGRYRETDCAPCPGSKCPAKPRMCWAPVQTDTGDRRRVTLVSALVYDLDNISFEELVAVQRRLSDVTFLLHSTHSYTLERPSVRLVLPLAQALSPEATRVVHDQVLVRYAIPADVKAHDVSRLFYLPSCPRDGERFVVHNDAGATVDTRMLAL